MSHTRRQFLQTVSALSAMPLLARSRAACAEPPPEIKRVRLAEALVACQAPLHLAEELLRAEGFTAVEYVAGITDIGPRLVASGAVDFTQWDVAGTFPLISEGKKLVVLAGVHAGCTELFAHDGIQALRDLKGKKIAVSALGNGDHVFAASILAYVGIKPQEVEWVRGPQLQDSKRLFMEGKADAMVAFEPENRELHEKKIGHVLLNTTVDKPWSQHFCCVLASNRDFVQKHPVATKRVLRALLKAADICAQEPERAARFMADKGYEKRYALGLEILQSIPYKRWREGSPEDTMRFHALRLYEVGMIKTQPNKLVAQGTDWRFLNEIKKELKS